MDGVLAINKPVNMSSGQVVARVKRYLKIKKVGHTGTLDPFATGLVLIALGKATRLSQFLLKSNKTYIATICLGIQTDTYDRTGQILEKADSSQILPITPKKIQQVVSSFLGTQQQVAPSFSALKYQGQPLYKLARKGIFIKKPPRVIEISDIKILSMDLPEFDLMIKCSSGTYIRSLAHDIGQELGCGAHLKELVRTESGEFTLDKSLDLTQFLTNDSEIHNLKNQNNFCKIAQQKIVSMSDSLSFLPKIIVGSHLIQKVNYGQTIYLNDLSNIMNEALTKSVQENSYLRILNKEEDLLAVVSLDKSSKKFIYSCVLI